MHVFTYDGDPDAEYWTVCQALRYLLLFHIPWALGVEFSVPKLFVNFADPDPLTLRDLYKTEAGQTPPSGPYPYYRSRATQRCPSLSVEDRRVLEAVLWVCTYAGLHLHEVHESVLAYGDSIYVRTALDLWDTRDQDVVTLHAERGHSHHDVLAPAGTIRSVPDIVNANEISQGQIQVDHRAAASDVLMLGDRHYVTVTAELLPMWPKVDRWDGTTGAVASATADAYRADAFEEAAPFQTLEDSTFFHRFNPHGNAWPSSESYRMAGRLWGVDCAGEFSATEYMRSEGPWAGEHAVPFDVSSLLVNNAGLPALADQVVRRRWMEPVTATDGTGRSLGVLLEISIDAGDEWYRLEDTFTVLGGMTLLYLKTADLLQVGQQVFVDHPNPPTANFYDAYLRGTLRLRATFNLDLDERVAEAGFGGGRLAAQHVTRGVMRDTDFRLVEADRFDNSINLHGASAIVGGLDDRSAASTAAYEMAFDMASAAHRASLLVPWHAIEYPLGTRVAVVATLPGVGTPDLLCVEPEQIEPVIVGRVFRQTNELSTELLLEDFELRPHLRPHG